VYPLVQTNFISFYWHNELKYLSNYAKKLNKDLMSSDERKLILGIHIFLFIIFNLIYLIKCNKRLAL
jgi:hypothetical protein